MSQCMAYCHVFLPVIVLCLHSVYVFGLIFILQVKTSKQKVGRSYLRWYHIRQKMAKENIWDGQNRKSMRIDRRCAIE